MELGAGRLRPVLGALVSLWVAACASNCAHATPQASAQSPGSRVALVIGVSDYVVRRLKLENPVEDAAYVAGALGKEGFDVQSLKNPTRLQMLDALAAFSAKAEKAEAAIIYYAGHGIEVDGVNYLVPADFQPPTQPNNAGGANLELTHAMKAMFTETALKAGIARDSLVGATKVRLLILDACREDIAGGDSTRGLGIPSGGLARESDGSATEVVTLMAAAPGKLAYDGQPPKHSPFAEALVGAIEQPGMIIGDLPVSVQTQVEEATRDQTPPQSPDQQGIFRDTRWSFGSITSITTGPTVEDTEAAAQHRLAREQAFWSTAKDSGDAADFQAYLDKVRSGEFSGLFKPLALNRIRSLEQAANAPAPSQASSGQPPPAPALTVTNASSAMALARRAYASGDLSTAAQAWNEAAREGSGSAMYNLGVLALTGRAGPKDLTKAAQWFLAAAQTGHAGGMENYGLCLINGYGLDKAPSDGVSWLDRAAVAGLPSAMALMGEVYLNGVGVAPDPAKAATWLQQAVSAGDGPALARLGEAYEQGVGVGRDPRHAFELYRRAALAGQPQGMVRVGYFFEDGEIGPPDLLQAATWYQRAADAGDPEGMSSLAVLLEGGRGVAKDETAAIRYYKMAADRNDPRGLVGLGALYARGVAVPQNDALAVDCFRRASELGSTTAMRNLATMYEFGRGVRRDPAEALHLFRQALAAGDHAAAEDVARLSSN